MMTKAQRQIGTKAQSEMRKRRNAETSKRGDAVGTRSASHGPGPAPALGVLIACVLLTSPAFGQSGGGYVIKKSTIGSGGHANLTDIDGTYKLGGTVGQHDAGELSGGGYALSGGFWSAAEACTCQLFGDVVSEFCLVDVDDLLCVLDDFVNPAFCLGDGDIFPCDPDGTAPFDHGDGINDVDDIAAVLQAFVGFSFCPDPCAP